MSALKQPTRAATTTATERSTARTTTTASSKASKAVGRRTSTKGADVTSTRQATFTVPTIAVDVGAQVAERLQQRLVGLLDLSLTLKHIHWNVVGPNFIGVHEMLDPQHAGVQAMIDDLAERVATLGAVPSGLPGRIVDQRTWTDYALDRADSIAHLGALDLVYQGVISDHRREIDELDELDPVSQDLLIGQSAVLEKYHWMVHSHLADSAGGMSNAGADTEMGAAKAVSDTTRTSAGSRSARRADER